MADSASLGTDLQYLADEAVKDNSLTDVAWYAIHAYLADDAYPSEQTIEPARTLVKAGLAKCPAALRPLSLMSSMIAAVANPTTGGRDWATERKRAAESTDPRDRC